MLSFPENDVRASVLYTMVLGNLAIYHSLSKQITSNTHMNTITNFRPNLLKIDDSRKFQIVPHCYVIMTQ